MTDPAKRERAALDILNRLPDYELGWVTKRYPGNVNVSRYPRSTPNCKASLFALILAAAMVSVACGSGPTYSATATTVAVDEIVPSRIGTRCSGIAQTEQLTAAETQAPPHMRARRIQPNFQKAGTLPG